MIALVIVGAAVLVSLVVTLALALLVGRVIAGRDEQVPLESSEVAADEQLIEQIRAGALIPGDDQLAGLLAEWRAECDL